MSSASVDATPKPARRRPHDRSEIRVSFLPEGNRAAKWAYICTLIGLVPGVGIIFGGPAVVLGLIGRRIAKNDELHRGLGHAFMSIVLGLLEIVCHSVGGWLLWGAITNT